MRNREAFAIYREYVTLRKRGFNLEMASVEMRIPASIIRMAVKHRIKPELRDVERSIDYTPDHSRVSLSFSEIVNGILGKSVKNHRIINSVYPNFKSRYTPQYDPNDFNFKDKKISGDYSFLERGIPSLMNEDIFI